MFIHKLHTYLRRFVFTLACSSILLLGVVSSAFASSYDVNAVVPYPTPSQPATIDGNVDGTTVHNALQTITGTCELMNPQTVVTIWRDTTAIGSAPCNGTYSLQVVLLEGSNTLFARTVNATGQVGPDSTPVTISLILPVPLPEPPPSAINNPPADQATINTVTNAGVASDLSAETSEPFTVMDTTNGVSIVVLVAGGDTPYVIMLDWGDGATESHSATEPGSYTFTHTYQKAGAYQIHGRVRDVLGAYTEFAHAVVTKQATPQPATTKSHRSTPLTQSHTGWWQKSSITASILVLLIILIIISSYWFGIRHATRQLTLKFSRARTKQARASRMVVAKNRKRHEKK